MILAHRSSAFGGKSCCPFMAAVLAASLIAFTVSFDEMVVTFFTTGFESTLPVVIWSMVQHGYTPGDQCSGSGHYCYHACSDRRGAPTPGRPSPWRFSPKSVALTRICECDRSGVPAQGGAGCVALMRTGQCSPSRSSGRSDDVQRDRDGAVGRRSNSPIARSNRWCSMASRCAISASEARYRRIGPIVAKATSSSSLRIPSRGANDGAKVDHGSGGTVPLRRSKTLPVWEPFPVTGRVGGFIPWSCIARSVWRAGTG